MDACAGKAVRKGIFRREDMVCTKTLYNYIDLGLINVKNIDLPFRVSRKTKKKRICENKPFFSPRRLYNLLLPMSFFWDSFSTYLNFTPFVVITAGMS